MPLYTRKRMRLTEANNILIFLWTQFWPPRSPVNVLETPRDPQITLRQSLTYQMTLYLLSCLISDLLIYGICLLGLLHLHVSNHWVFFTPQP